MSRVVRPGRALLVATATALLLAAGQDPPTVRAGAPGAGLPRVGFEVMVSSRPVGDGRLSDRMFEPVVATHPTDPRRIAVAYTREGNVGTCGIDPGLRFSDDGAGPSTTPRAVRGPDRAAAPTSTPPSPGGPGRAAGRGCTGWT